MKEFISKILGDIPAIDFMVLWFFALVGVAIRLLIDVQGRDKLSFRTPYRFSWNWLWLDNARRILATVLLIFVSLRFCEEVFGVAISPWIAVLIGLISDRLAGYLKDKNILGQKLTKDDIAKNP